MDNMDLTALGPRIAYGYEKYARRMEKELIVNRLGIGTIGGLYDRNNALWPMALLLVRVCFACNPTIFKGYGGMADDMSHLSELSELADCLVVRQ